MRQFLLPLGYACFGALAFLLIGCNHSSSARLSEGDMVEVMADLETAEAYIQTQGGARTEEFKEALLADVLQKRGYSREQFDSTMSWYSRNIDEFYPLYAKVEKELIKRSRKAGGAQLPLFNGSELWPYSKMAAILPGSGSDLIRFSIPSPDLEKGDKIFWKARSRYPAEYSALLGVEYEDGHCGFVTKSFSAGRGISLDLQTDSAASVVRIFGNLLADSHTSIPLWLDSISLTKVPIDTLEYNSILSQHIAHRPASHPKLSKVDVEEDSIREVEEKPDVSNQQRKSARHSLRLGTSSMKMEMQ